MYGPTNKRQLNRRNTDELRPSQVEEDDGLCDALSTLRKYIGSEISFSKYVAARKSREVCLNSPGALWHRYGEDHHTHPSCPVERQNHPRELCPSLFCS
ncbi:hypothetical protein Ahy_B08g092040 isoform B [Arachis hypogaea]|uniref:Uncharacterized protein n=1 Tax=Arachis hypogaea TaxID=3818 RepID=A0A444Y331_ARAHY|nr:hypothetical protein Ahy_B08g092040 isoform B [Arachis hypogaea]